MTKISPEFFFPPSAVARNGKLLPNMVKQVHSSENERKRLNVIVEQEGV